MVVRKWRRPREDHGWKGGGRRVNRILSPEKKEKGSVYITPWTYISQRSLLILCRIYSEAGLAAHRLLEPIDLSSHLLWSLPIGHSIGGPISKAISFPLLVPIEETFSAERTSCIDERLLLSVLS